MNKLFLQKGFNKQLSHVIEECGEVLAAAGKLQRWGKDSFNPITGGETNIDWLKRELDDLENAIQRLKFTIKRETTEVTKG